MGAPVPERREAARRPPVSLIVIAALAAAAAIVHVVFPDLAIDAVTLGLLGVAALPWLAQIVKTLKFGSLEIDLKDIQRDIYEVREKVVENAQKVDDLADQVQKITFTGAIEAHGVETLTEAMNGFYIFLRKIGFPVPPAEPVVDVVDRPGIDPMYFDPGKEKILVSGRLAGDVTRVLQSYAQFLCTSIVAVPYGQWSPQLRLIARGLSMYLPCSYRGSPEVAPESYAVYRRDAPNEDRRRYLQTVEKQANLQANRARISRGKFADVAVAQNVKNSPAIGDTLAWAGAVWRLREVLTPEITDRALVAGWTQLAAGPDLAAFDAIVAAVLQVADEQGDAELAARVGEVFRRRGLVPASG